MTSVYLSDFKEDDVQIAWRNFMRFCINLLRGMCHMAKNVLPQNIDSKGVGLMQKHAFFDRSGEKKRPNRLEEFHEILHNNSQRNVSHD